MKRPLNDFIQAKNSEAYILDEDKFFDYPIDIVDVDGVLKQFYIQDVSINHTPTELDLHVIVLNEDKKAYDFRQHCKMPEGSIVDIDSIKCAYTIDLR